MPAIPRTYGLTATTLLGLALALAVLGTASRAAGVSQQHARGAGAISISMAADGRRHEIDAAGVVNDPGARASTRLHVVLQQLTEKRGRWLWSSRVSGTASYWRSAVRFFLRWRHPPANRRLVLRTIAMSAGTLVARSASVEVRAGDPGAAFYSGDGDAGANRAGAAKWILTADKGKGYNGYWVSSRKCDPSKATNVPASVHGENISTLAGFSLG